MTLRDELEKKLRGIYVNADSDVFGLIADECIRQMEWARREGMDGDRDKPYEVSLAPPEWKP